MKQDNINKSLENFFESKRKHKFKSGLSRLFKRTKKEPSVDEMHPGLESGKIHIIEKDMSLFNRFVGSLKTRKNVYIDKTKPDAEKEIEEKAETEDTQKDDAAVKPEEITEGSAEETKKGIEKEKGPSFMGFMQDFISKKLEKKDIPSKNIEPDFIVLHPETKKLIQSLIRINVDILAKLTPEELENFRKTDDYREFKEHIKKFKELAEME